MRLCRRICFLLLLASCLVCSSLQQSRQPISCFHSDRSVDPVGNQTCELGVNTCYEYVYGRHGLSHLTYTAGCGGRIRAPYYPSDYNSGAPVDERIVNCHGQSFCNQKLWKQLKKGSRFCPYALVTLAEPNESVVCPPGEFRCFYERSASRVPFFNAGCGSCPAYTFNCSICYPNGVCNITAGGAILDDDLSTRGVQNSAVALAAGLASAVAAIAALCCRLLATGVRL